MTMNANASSTTHRPAPSRAPADLRVHVGDLLARPGVQRVLVGEIVLPDLGVTSAGVPGDEAVELDLRLEAIAEGVVVSGHVTAPWRGACSRCLDGVEGVVDVSLHELFERRPVESETYPLDGEEIDLEPMVRDAVLLQVPVLPLCDDACLGLCPVCGADRNVERCNCSQAANDPRWAVLSALEFPDTTD